MNNNLTEQKEKNIRKTWFLMLFVTALLVLVGTYLSKRFNNPLILYGFLLFSFVQNIVSFWFSDKIALRSAGARAVTKEEEPMLYRVAERVALKNKMKVPRIYVIDDSAPNAFATGRNEDNAAIAATKGILDILTEEELEGVIAHEFGHIKNRDILISTVAGILIGFIVMILSTLSHTSTRSNDDNGVGNFGIIFGMLSMVLAPLFAQLIQLSISRKREFLADATGALTTGHPEDLASALQKISANAAPLRNVSPETSHLFIANPYGKLKNLFMSHPPVEERIAALLGKNKDQVFK